MTDVHAEMQRTLTKMMQAVGILRAALEQIAALDESPTALAEAKRIAAENVAQARAFVDIQLAHWETISESLKDGA